MTSPVTYIKLSMHLSRLDDPSLTITEEEMDLWIGKLLQWIEDEGELECAFGMWSLVDEDNGEE